MKLLGNILYLEKKDYTDYGGSEDYWWKKTAQYQRGEIKSWLCIPDPINAKNILVNYDTIPRSTIEKYGIPPKAELIKALALETLGREVQVNKKDLEYYMNNRSTIDLANEYSRIAAWMWYNAEMRPSEAVKKGYEDKEHLYEVCIKLMEEEAKELKWKSWGVSNLLVFKRRLKPFIQHLKGKTDRETALSSLIYKRLGLTNAQKVNEAFEKVILFIYVQKGSGIKLLADQVYYEYELVREGKKMLVDVETGEVVSQPSPLTPEGGTSNAQADKTTTLPEVCVRTVKNFLSEPRIQLITSKLRDGSKYANDKFRPYIMRMKPNYSGSMTSSDGAVIPLRLIINKKLTWKRALAYLIFDVKSECIIGVAYDMEENLEVMNEAFKNMLLWTEGYTPMENQLDNFGRGNKANLEKIFKYVSFCEPYNPQSKYAERLIGHFESSELRKIRGWQGTNNQSKKQSGKKNPDIEDVGYTFEDVVKLHQNAVQTWNNTVPNWCKSGKTRLQLWSENKNPEALQLQDRELARLAGKSKVGNIVRGFVKVEYDGVEYDFEVSNHAELTSELDNGWSVRVSFLPPRPLTPEGGTSNAQGINKVWLYNYKDKKDTTEDTYLCECLAVVKPQGSKAEQTAADREALQHQMANKARFDRWMEEQEAKIPRVKIISLQTPEGGLSQEEAAGILASGYTDKGLMNEAESLIGNVSNAPFGGLGAAKNNREMKPERMEIKKELRERNENSKRLKELLYESPKINDSEMELVEVESKPKFTKEELQRLRYEL